MDYSPRVDTSVGPRTAAGCCLAALGWAMGPLGTEKRRILAPQEEESLCAVRRSVFLCHKQRFLLVLQEQASLVPQEAASVCATRRGLFLCTEKGFFLGHNKRLLFVPQE